MRLAVVAIAFLALAGCASMGRAMSYGSDWADAKVTVGTHRFAIWVHDRDRTILINRDNVAAAGQGIQQGVAFGLANARLPEAIWRDAGNALLATMGCAAVDVYPIDTFNHVSWEATYSCPDGVDPRREVATRREIWRQGIVAPEHQSAAAG